jgi:RND family efflux transporter MFP subunit
MKAIMSITAGVLAVTITGCSKKEVTHERPTPVEVQAVQAFSGNDEKRFSAIIQPFEQVELSFRVGGYVQNIAQTPGVEGHMRSIQDGDRIASGQMLARLRSSEYRARAEQAKASIIETQSLLVKAELDRSRAEKLFSAQSMTKPDFDTAKANYESIQARLESAQARFHEASSSLDDTVLRAPFSGTLLKRNIALGSLASPGVPAFVLADTTVVKAIFGVPDKLMPRMQIGNTLTLGTDYSQAEVKGKITRVSAAADAKSRVFEVEVSIPNAKNELRPGMVSTLVIDNEVPEQGMAVIPVSAIVSSTKRPGKYAVYTAVTENGRTVGRLVEIELGRTLGNQIVVTSGLNVGEPIITTGSGLLRDGEPIEVVSNQPKELAQKY